MANHKSTKKRIRSTAPRAVRNKYNHKTVRNAIKAFRATEKKTDAAKLFPGLVSAVDRLVKRNIFHKNKAANLKSQFTKHVSSLK
ncbi:MAG: small subunit ribosomal protein S20 [Patiriisocius sp.]|jgi:small subunit ribosomal protein S20